MRFELRVENLEPETRNSKPGTIIMEHLLAVDVGGTKTDLALYDAGLGCRNPLWQETLPSQDYATFTELLHRFLDGKQVQLKGACLGVAGPVQGNRVKLTNLPWEIVGSEIEAEFGIDQVSIINDLVAIAHSIPFLSDDDLVVLKGGNVVSGGARGVVAPGTGLGIAFSVWDGSQYIVNPSEGGHAGFSPADEIELELLRFMFSRSEEPVSFESLCSGMGFPAIYRFLIEQGHFGEPYWLAAELASGGDVTPVIVQAADTISSSRPGVRKETLTNYVNWLSKLEEIADSFKGVGKSYVIQAGREIRVMVEPDNISDAEAEELAMQVSQKIQSEMEYPGQIKVTTIREIRFTEYAK